MKADKLADGIETTGKLNYDVLKSVADEIRNCWVVNQLDCAKHLTDDEFETLQGLIKKVEILKDLKDKKKKGRKDVVTT